MAKVVITDSLSKRIYKTFKDDSQTVLELLATLKNNPKKGKPVGQVSGIVIKEMKYKVHHFYCIMDGHQVKFFKEEELKDLLIKFVAMSDKNTPQKVIDEIKNILKKLGPEGF